MPVSQADRAASREAADDARPSNSAQDVPSPGRGGLPDDRCDDPLPSPGGGAHLSARRSDRGQHGEELDLLDVQHARESGVDHDASVPARQRLLDCTGATRALLDPSESVVRMVARLLAPIEIKAMSRPSGEELLSVKSLYCIVSGEGTIYWPKEHGDRREIAYAAEEEQLVRQLVLPDVYSIWQPRGALSRQHGGGSWATRRRQWRWRRCCTTPCSRRSWTSPASGRRGNGGRRASGLCTAWTASSASVGGAGGGRESASCWCGGWGITRRGRRTAARRRWEGRWKRGSRGSR